MPTNREIEFTENKKQVEHMQKIVEDILHMSPAPVPDHILRKPDFHKAMVNLSEQQKTEDLGKGVYQKFIDGDNPKDKYVDAIDKLIQEVENPKEKTKVATGRKAGREKKSALESLKVHKHKVQLAAKRDEVNFVESILDNTRTLTIPTKWNPAVINLNPLGGHFIEEGILQENLRKIQGFK